jgi:colanic acid/amylovoran biosynthesis glycosyltransferase
MRIAYITCYAPWGRQETFIIEEMLAAPELGAELLIIPRNPPKEFFHRKAEPLLEHAVWLPLLSLRILLYFFLSLFIKPRVWRVIWEIVRHSRSMRMRLKNLAVLPKGVYVARMLRKRGVRHIHAHWGGTSSTMAYAAARLTGIPWSMTLHRWDITENNMLKRKVAHTASTRCISQVGYDELLSIVGESLKDKVTVIHMGARIPEKHADWRAGHSPRFTIACPANLLPVKGHSYLVEACSLLRKNGVKNFQCLLLGDGPFEEAIRAKIAELGISETVKMPGRVSHEDLLAMYRRGDVQCVILPSVDTDDGEHEGIPIALIEAMAHGIPVISTDTGGIPELIGDGSGIMVREKDPQAIADAIACLMNSTELCMDLSRKGFAKVNESFNLLADTRRLLDLMKAEAQ